MASTPGMEWALAANQVMQGGYSAYLMGERNKTAREDLSLRQRSFAAELERQKEDLNLRKRDMTMRENLNKIAVRQANDAFDLEEAQAFAYPEINNQFSQLQKYASDEDVEGLRSASFKPVVLPANFSRQTQDKLNSVLSARFRDEKMAAMGASSAVATKRQTIENLLELNTKLARDAASNPNAALRRHLADETRALIQAGIPISKLPNEMAALVAEADSYAAERKLASSEKYKTAEMLALAKTATASAAAQKDKFGFYDDRIKSLDNQLKNAMDSATGVNMPIGPQKDMLPVQVEEIDFLNRYRQVLTRNTAMARSGYRSDADMANLFEGEESFVEVEYEYTEPEKIDPRTNQKIPSRRVKNKADLSTSELPRLMQFLNKTNGKVNSQKIVTRPTYKQVGDEIRAKQKPAEKAGQNKP